MTEIRLPSSRRGGAPALPCLGFGGASAFCSSSEETALGLLDHAWARGIRYYDTAPFYGEGLSERRFGTSLRRYPRDSFLLSTKVGRLLRPDASDPAPEKVGCKVVYDYSYDGVLRSLDESLQRLELDRIDIAYIHDVNPWWQGEHYEARFREAVEGGFRALDRLRGEGAIRAVGVGTRGWEVCLRFARAVDLDCIMLAGGYTLLEHASVTELLPYCREREIAVVIASPFNSGILAAGAESGASYFYASPPNDVIERTRRMARVCARHGVPLGAAAIQFPLAHPAVRGVVCGFTRAAEVDTNLGWLHAPIPADLWAELKAAKLLAAEAPTPGGMG